jgi:hypothetical protein
MCPFDNARNCVCESAQHITSPDSSYFLIHALQYSAATSSLTSCKAAMTTLWKCCANSSAAWAFPPAARGGILGELLEPPTGPRHAGTFIATCAPASARCSQMHRSSILLQLRFFVQLLTPLATLLLCRRQQRRPRVLRICLSRDIS